MKTVKRTLAVFLSLLMLISAVPLGMMNVSAAYTPAQIAQIRSNLVSYFHEMATVKWTAGATFKVNVAKGTQTYYSGKTYYGLPYAQKSGSTALSVENYKKAMSNGRISKFIGQSDCSTSMGVAYKKYLGIQQLWSVSCFMSSGYGFNKVGSIGDYSSLQPGDVVANGGHVMMVISVDKTKKTVKVTHQSSGFFTYNTSSDTTGNSQTSMANRNCSWGVNQTKSYADLKSGKYQGYQHRLLAGNIPEIVKTPTISSSNIVNGQTIKITCATSGATIYYTLDGKTPTTSSTKYTGAFNLTTTKTVKAIAVKTGMTNSSVTSKTITVNKVAKPTISSAPTSSGYKVTLSSATSGATIYYTTNGATPTTSSTKYTGAFAAGGSETVNAIAVKVGMANSDPLSAKIPDPVPPAAPTIRLKSASDIGIGDAVQIEWNAVNNAQEYYVYVNDAEQPATNGTVAAITLSNAGSYSITVKSHNAFGYSTASNAAMVVVHNNATVTFAFDDGSIIDEQSVKYGGNAIAPAAPSKIGHTFTGWKGTYVNVKNDVIIVAEFIREQYRITFVDANGNTLKSKNVYYGDAFGAEDIPSVAASTGYKFSAWVVKSGTGDSYEFANGDVTFEPSFVWANPDVPLALSIEKAERKSDSTGYTVDVKITNGTASPVEGKLVSVIKTSYDQMLVTEITNISIPANASNLEKTVNIACKDVGKVAEVYIVANDKDNSNRTGGAYSAVATKEVTKEESATYTYWGDWSEWQETPVTESDTREVETKEQYSYRDKQTTTNTSSSLSEWTPSGSSVSYGSWGSWSGWSLTSQTKSDTKDVETRTVYYYYHYCDGNGNFAPSTSYAYGKYGPHTLYSTTKFKIDRTSTTGLSIADGETKCEKKCGSYYYGGTKTQYRYRTRTKTTTYSFWKWGDWSSYDDAVVYASDNRQVQTRTVYRYRDLLTATNTTSTTDIGVEKDRVGQEYTVQGTLSNVVGDYTGKLATVMVYKEKNTDPTEEQMEYMTQITIGANNSYAFPFLPKEAISVTTGDYIVSFGIATADRLINNIEKIAAPKPIYDVTFKSYDGTIIETQKVTEGDDAAAPVMEVPEGYELRWNRTLTNITKSVEITAVISPKTFTVVFVDWANSEIVKIDENVAYGSEINFPADRSAEGKVFTGWSLPQGSTVSNTMVIEAQYDDVMVTVSFLNQDGSVYLATEVPYGSNAELPEENPTAEGYEFLAWSNETNWWNVKEKVSVKPVFIYDKDVEEPVIIFEPEAKRAPVAFELETATEDAEIHYTLDGSEPTEEDAIFEDETIFVAEKTVLKARAFKANMNPSPVAEMTLEVVPESDIPAVSAVTNVSQYEVGADYAKICMKLENPEGFAINAYGYTIYNENTEDVRDYENTSIAGATDTVLGKVFTVSDLAPGTYVYSFYAEIEDIGYVTSESESFTIGTPPPHVHTYDDGIITQQPSCFEDGVMTYTCTTCDAETEGHTKTEIIPAFGEHAAPDEHGNCSRCGDHILDVCKWCGKQHNGFFQKIIGFFHNILAAIFGKKY